MAKLDFSEVEKAIADIKVSMKSYDFMQKRFDRSFLIQRDRFFNNFFTLKRQGLLELQKIDELNKANIRK